MCFDIIWQIVRMERSGLPHPPPPPLLEGLWYEMHYAVIVPNDGSSSLRRQQYHEDPHGKLLSWLFVVDKSTNWGPVKILASLDIKFWITIPFILWYFIEISSWGFVVWNALCCDCAKWWKQWVTYIVGMLVPVSPIFITLNQRAEGHFATYLPIFPYELAHGATTQIEKLMEPTWGPPGSCRPQMGPMLAPWTLLSGNLSNLVSLWSRLSWAHMSETAGCIYIEVLWNCLDL